MSTKKAKEINDKYNKLKPYIYNYRTINGDGNCFYRAVMFRYLEILVLNRKVDLLQNVAYDVYNSFNSEELKSRLVIGNINLKPALALKLLILIIELLKKGNVLPTQDNSDWCSNLNNHEYIEISKDDDYFKKNNCSISGYYGLLVVGFIDTSFTLFVSTHKNKVFVKKKGINAFLDIMMLMIKVVSKMD